MQEDQGEDGERSTEIKTKDRRPTNSLLENLAPSLYVKLRDSSSSKLRKPDAAGMSLSGNEPILAVMGGNFDCMMESAPEVRGGQHLAGGPCQDLPVV